MEPNTLYYGDCLDWMQRWDDASVDLIYLDPPFNSKTNYNILYSTAGGGQAQYRAFDDTWHWDEAAADRYAMFESAAGRPAHRVIVGLYHILGPSGMLAYLTYMAERLEQMHRLLKPTGSLYLHCDPTMSHYLKLVMDTIFGADKFRNEVAWCYRGGGVPKSDFARKHDIIFRYSKSKSVTFNVDDVRIPYSDDVMNSSASRYDKSYRTNKVYEGYRPNKLGKHPEDWWTIQPIMPSSSERMGYPTQKPLALLERIIKASSNPGDIVLDPFCGCGTSIDAARRLGRHWVGIDISSFAIDLIRERRLLDTTIPTHGIPYDLASARKLAAEQPFNFESWAVTRLPGFAPNAKQIADGGVDGRATLAEQPSDYDSRLALAQIKGGKFSLSALRDFIGVTDRDRAALGCYVTLDPVNTSAARRAVAATGTVTVAGYPYRRMQLWAISDYFEGRLPALPIMADPYTGRALQPLLSAAGTR